MESSGFRACVCAGAGGRALPEKGRRALSTSLVPALHGGGARRLRKIARLVYSIVNGQSPGSGRSCAIDYEKDTGMKKILV